MKPIMFQGTLPLCSAQYERQFNTTRVPGLVRDELVHFDSSTSNHIVVYDGASGKFFRVDIVEGDRQLQPSELEMYGFLKGLLRCKKSAHWLIEKLVRLSGMSEGVLGPFGLLRKKIGFEILWFISSSLVKSKHIRFYKLNFSWAKFLD